MLPRTQLYISSALENLDIVGWMPCTRNEVVELAAVAARSALSLCLRAVIFDVRSYAQAALCRRDLAPFGLCLAMLAALRLNSDVFSRCMHVFMTESYKRVTLSAYARWAVSLPSDKIYGISNR